MQIQNHNPFEKIDLRFDQLQELIVDLQNKLDKAKPELNPHERLTRSDVRKDYRISFGTIHNAMKSKKLPFEKVGRKTLYKRIDVENWINKKG